MATVLIILGLVAGLSLYDYLSSRSWQMITAEDRVEAVFENRNKNYGAYKIRRDYNLLVLLITLGIGGAIAASYGISKAIPEEKVVVEKEAPLDLSTFAGEDEKEKEDELEPLEEKVPEEQRTLAFIPPVILDNAPEDEMPDQEQFNNAEAGANNNEGGDFGGPGDDGPKDPPPPPPPPPEIFDIVDEPAGYPGGRAAMMEYLGKNIKYPDIAQEMQLQGKCHLKFVVSETGNISNVKVLKGVPDCKECDDEAVRVVKSMPDWTPAKVNGKPVNSYFTMPVNFKLSN